MNGYKENGRRWKTESPKVHIQDYPNQSLPSPKPLGEDEGSLSSLHLQTRGHVLNLTALYVVYLNGSNHISITLDRSLFYSFCGIQFAAPGNRLQWKSWTLGDSKRWSREAEEQREEQKTWGILDGVWVLFNSGMEEFCM